MATDTFSSTATLVDSAAEVGQLCNNCRRLDLGTDKFIIKKTSSSFDHGTTSLSASKFDLGKVPRLTTGDPRIAFASVRDVQRNQDSCRFCGLLSRAVVKYSPGKLTDGQAMLFLTWEVDGRQMLKDDRHVNRTRRLRVTWTSNGGIEQNVYLVLVDPGGVRQTDSEAYALSATASHFLGRGLVQPKDKQSLIKSWIELCVGKHGNDCLLNHGSTEDFKKLAEGTCFGVIDVVDLCLKELPFNSEGKPENYIALSYVWGKRNTGDPVYTTIRANIMLHIQHGGIEKAWSRLPRTIQDAILLTSRLGERYIWIDSLCIVQDSITSWELNAKAMHLIYGNAKFTICAADGDAETGLLAVQSMLRSNIASSVRHDPGSIIDDNPQIATSRLTAECLPGVRLLVTKAPEVVIQDSEWNKRGWTFQERLLSRRCLVFAEGHIYFQCRSSVMSQDIFTDGGATGWSLDRANAPLKTLGELARRAFWFYMTCIGLYTGRQLTQSTDILSAFQGTSWLLQQRMNAPLFYGLPTSHFDLSLLWSSTGILTRRTKEKSSLVKGKDGKDFPSWSWCGWVGGKSEYRAELIEGCLINVHEFLINHTWIFWYFRDREGNLRPLRDSTSSREDASEDSRWVGYCGKLARQRHVSRNGSSSNESEIESWISENAPLDVSSSQRSREPISLPGPQARGQGARDQAEWNREGNSQYVDRIGAMHHPASGPNFDPSAPYQPFSLPSTWGTRPHSAYPAYPAYATYPAWDPPPPSRAPVEPYQTYPPYPRAAPLPRPPGAVGRRRHENSIARPGRGLANSDSGEESDDNTYSVHRSGRNFEIRDSRNLDCYGRKRRYPDKSATSFTKITPDNPFGVITGPYPSDDEDFSRAMPILQFWTWQTWLFVRNAGMQDNPHTSAESLVRHNILDKAWDWCGSIDLPGNWAHDDPHMEQVFIAISDAKAFTKEECNTWNYYIPKERDESEWDLYYVLLLRRDPERALWERVGLGKVFQAAFSDADWQEIKLG